MTPPPTYPKPCAPVRFRSRQPRAPDPWPSLIGLRRAPARGAEADLTNGRQRMWTYTAIGFFGVLGCWARFAQTNFVQGIYGRDFPYATLSINVLGSFLMGFLFFLTLERLTVAPALRAGILTGFLGGYTTFSTFEMETLLLAESGEALKAALYVGLSVVLGFAAAFGGAYLARNI